MVDYRRAFTAIRKDPKWMRKLALGVPISLIPYVGMVWMMGWEMQYQRNVAWGEDERLPGWSDFTGQAMLGLKGFVAVLPYSLAMSMLIVPLSLAMPLLVTMAEPFGGSAVALSVVASSGVIFFLVMGVTLLMLPLTASAMLRVALYGTFESG